MSFTALQSLDDVTAARGKLDAGGWSYLSPAILRPLKRYRLWQGLVVGDRLKSWDVFTISSFIAEHLKPDDAVLDLGAYCSEMLPVLHRRGFRNLTGIDFNPKLGNMPYATQIRYLVGDFHQVQVADASQKAVTAVSVIEHGFQPARLLETLKRIIAPGGYFLATLDYWPVTIETHGKTIFDMSWTLFDEQKIREFVAQAAQAGFQPIGPLQFTAKLPPPVRWEGFDYTFGLLILQNGHDRP